MKAVRVEYEMSEEAYRDMLDEIYGDVQICGMTYSSGRALQELDPIAFRCGKADEESEHGDTWKCSECDTEYETEDEANECCAPEETDEETD